MNCVPRGHAKVEDEKWRRYKQGRGKRKQQDSHLSTIPPFPGAEHCVYREYSERKILAAAPTGPYVRSSPVTDSSLESYHLSGKYDTPRNTGERYGKPGHGYTVDGYGGRRAVYWNLFSEQSQLKHTILSVKTL